MNLNKYFLAVASVMMLAACTNENLPLEEQEVTAPVYIPGDSEVEILLGSRGNNVTVKSKRAAFEGDADMDQLGVFCLAREKQHVNQAAQDIVWFTDDEENWSGCIMNNVEAIKTGSTVTWADATKHYYYPVSQFYCYDFFGYYPYSEDVTIADEKVMVNYELDGKTEIIWGRATSDEDYAYSATYFRQEENVGNYPTLDLHHVLTRLKFFVTPGAEVEGGTTVSPKLANFAVARIEVLDAISNVQLTVADKANINTLNEQNCLTVGENRADYVLCGFDGEPMDTTMVGTDLSVSTRLGESVLLAPESEYTIRVYLINKESGEKFVTEHPLKVNNASSTFLPGYTYNVNITAHAPEEIQLEAALNPWVDADESENPSIIL